MQILRSQFHMYILRLNVCSSIFPLPQQLFTVTFFSVSYKNCRQIIERFCWKRGGVGSWGPGDGLAWNDGKDPRLIE